MNWYSKAIDILTGPALDYKSIVINYAKRHPKEFCLFCASETPNFKLIYVQQGKVHAIKAYRDYAQCSLKEAAEYINRIAGE